MTSSESIISEGWNLIGPFPTVTKRLGAASGLTAPADALIDALREALGTLPVIAEDLGYMTQEVYEFRERTGFPGMKILQFAFNPDAASDYLPHNLTENAVLYTGTHDNDTVAAWIARILIPANYHSPNNTLV